MKILLVTAPFCQLNTPYPATAFLKGWLRREGHQILQADTGLECALRLFSSSGLEDFVFSPVNPKDIAGHDSLCRIMALKERYKECINPVISFLQGKDSTLASLLCSPGFLPEGERFLQQEFQGDDALTARLRGTLFLEDLADFHKATVDPDFGFSRYAEQLALSPSSFDALYDRAQETEQPLSRVHRQILQNKIEVFQPEMVGFSVPFPGNLLESLRAAAFIKKAYPDCALTLGGGYINTELRQLSDPRLGEFFDSVTLDDGEDSLSAIAGGKALKRTWLFQDKTWQWHEGDGKRIKHKDRPAPDYSDLPLQDYLSLADRENPMHRLWSEGPWIKMMLAHGCYWSRCAFCDTSLDYIGRFDPAPAEVLVDQIEELIEKTGKRSFHFVDEAAPPALLRELALELIKRKIVISWWTNIRFEKNFSAPLCRLLSESGCIAVSGGLEVASDRLLESMDKGVNIEQVARVCAGFRSSGIMVHAYLMYGFPGQNAQEVMDALETVRQLFLHDLVQSAFWHHFALTAHSPVGLCPEKFAVTVTGPEFQGFARNDLLFEKESEDLTDYGPGLKAAVYNYMRGQGFDLPLKRWFSFKTPMATVPKKQIACIKKAEQELEIRDGSRLIWLGPLPEYSESGFIIRGNDYQEELTIEKESERQFCLSFLEKCQVKNGPFKVKDFDLWAEEKGVNPELWLGSTLFQELLTYALLVL